MTSVSPPTEPIGSRIRIIRGHKVMLDRDLALLYGTTTKALNQAVRRNLNRFPDDFMFRLEPSELIGVQEDGSRSQIVTLNRGQNLKYPALAFTEQGIAMLSSVLRTERAAQVNIAIMRAFMKLRELAASHREWAKKLDALEQKYDAHFKVIFDAIRNLMEDSKPPRHIGFRPEEPK